MQLAATPSPLMSKPLGSFLEWSPKRYSIAWEKPAAVLGYILQKESVNGRAGSSMGLILPVHDTIRPSVIILSDPSSISRLMSLNGLNMIIYGRFSYLKTPLRAVHIGETNRVEWSESI